MGKRKGRHRPVLHDDVGRDVFSPLSEKEGGEERVRFPHGGTLRKKGKKGRDLHASP